MSNLESPCKGCIDKYINCHSACLKYAKYCHDNDEKKKIIQSNKLKEQEIKGFKSTIYEGELRRKRLGVKRLK